MTHAEKSNPVLSLAEADYQPAFVAIDDVAIAQCQPGGRLKAMGATLPLDSVALGMEGIPYFIAMNTLNFQFWQVESSEFIRYRHNGLEGALAMQAAFLGAWVAAAQRAVAAGRPANDVQFIARELIDLFSREGLSGVFGEIPEIVKRARVLMDVLGDGDLLFNLSGEILDALVTRRKLDWEDAEKLAKAFPDAYRDDYLKKAQLTLMFIAGQWNERNPRHLCTLDVTAAADYQLPKILRAMGVLRYSPPLAAKVDHKQLIEAESIAERAIRAATVLACEKLARHLRCTVPEVDFFLWSNRNKAREAQFHLTRTTAY